MKIDAQVIHIFMSLNSFAHRLVLTQRQKVTCKLIVYKNPEF